MRRHWLLALSFLVPTAATAAEIPTALASDGTVYRILAGTCADLAVCSTAIATDTPVLALEWEAPGQAIQRVMVPGTDTPAGDNDPALAMEAAGNSVYIVWQAIETVHSKIHLTSFTDGEWMPVVEITGDPYGALSFKRNPRLAVTSDSYLRLDSTGTLVRERRMVLHLVWWEQSGAGERTLYTALVVQDGELLLDWNPVALTDLLDDSTAFASVPPGLSQAPRVWATGADRVLVGFADGESGRIATVEIDVVGGEVVSFADAARAQIIDIGRQLGSGNRKAVVDGARAQIIDIGKRLLGAEVAGFMTDRFLGAVAAADPGEDLELVVDGARAQIIDIGRRLDEGIQLANADARAQIIDIGRRSSTEGQPAHLASLRIAGTWEAPWLPDRAIRMMTSGNGSVVALAWDLETAVRYRELEPAGWGELKTVSVGQQLTRAEAYELIEQRLRRF